MSESANYDINFFTPRTPFLKENIRIIVVCLLIWAVFTFGFQIVMRVIEEPTPQPAYTTFEAVYPKLQDGAASLDEKRAIAQVYLALISKTGPRVQNDVLKTAFTAATYQILPPDQREAFQQIASRPGPARDVDLSHIETALGIEGDAVLEALLPFALAPITGDAAEMTHPEIPPLMEKYLIHYRSALTDARFLGFPLPYFYSAVFLLVLFNLICLVYCYIIDGVMKKHGMESATE